jgi:hypothetical protein
MRKNAFITFYLFSKNTYSNTGAVKYTMGSKVATFSAFIRPSIFATTNTSNGAPNVSEESWQFFEELTALKRAELFAHGKEFSEVWKDFRNFVGV